MAAKICFLIDRNKLQQVRTLVEHERSMRSNEHGHRTGATRASGASAGVDRYISGNHQGKTTCKNHPLIQRSKTEKKEDNEEDTTRTAVILELSIVDA